MDAFASPNCDAAASAGTWRLKPPVAHVALGGWQRAPRSTWPCQSCSSGHSVWLPSRLHSLHNLPNRRIRTRTSGGVGGAQPQGCPLSRFRKRLRRQSRLVLVAGTNCVEHPFQVCHARSQQRGTRALSQSTSDQISGERLVLPDRIELSTSPLPMECSTTELRQHARYMKESALKAPY